MPFSEFERKRCEKLTAQFTEGRRPPPFLRDQVDLTFRVGDLSVEIFEIRPHWQDPSIRMEHPVAKAKFNRTRGVWKIFWMRSTGDWTRYDPLPEVAQFEEFLAIVGEDEHACFFG